MADGAHPSRAWGYLYADSPDGDSRSLLVVLAVSKAALVALYFMHLKFERVPWGSWR